MLTQCPSCKHDLSVLDSMLNQPHRCPHCQHVFPVAPVEPALPEQPTVTLPTSPLQDAAASAPGLVKCPFCAERIPSVASYCPYCGENVEEEEPDDRPWEYPELGRRDAEPHRAGMILAMAIASMVVAPLAICCSFLGAILTIPGLALGITAWRMAHVDLKKMHAGTMDRRGRPTVQAARVCAIVGTVLCSLATLGALAMVALVSYSTFSQPTIQPMPAPGPAPVIPPVPPPAPGPPPTQRIPLARGAPCPCLPSFLTRTNRPARIPCQA